MDLLIADLWPGMESSDAEASEELARDKNFVPLSYPQYVALLLHAGLRAGIPSSIVHQVFQLTGQWELEDPMLSLHEESLQGKIIAHLVPEVLPVEDNDNGCEQQAKPASTTSDSNVVEQGCPAPLGSFCPEAFFCAHLSRENAELFIEKPSTLPPFHYLKKPLSNDALLGSCLPDATPSPTHPDDFLPLDCLYCLQKQLFSPENQNKKKSKNPVVVVNTLYSADDTASIQTNSFSQEHPPGRETIAIHYQSHQKRCDKYLAMLEGEEVAYLGESGDEFELDSETGREACEENAEEEGRHACFVCVAGTSTCPVAVCYCAACNIFGPLTKFSCPDPVSPLNTPSGMQSDTHVLQDSSLWVSSDSSATVVARLLLAFHILLEAKPDLFTAMKKEQAVHSYSTQSKTEVKKTPLSSSVVSCTEGEYYKIGEDCRFPPLRSSLLFFQTPLIFQDPPSIMDLEEQDDDQLRGPRAEMTAKFEEEITEMISAEAVLPGARWIKNGKPNNALEESDEHVSLHLRARSTLKQTQKQPLLEFIPSLLGGNPDQMQEKNGLDNDPALWMGDLGLPNDTRLVLAHDVVVGLLVSFGTPEALEMCIRNTLIPQIHAEALNHTENNGNKKAVSSLSPYTRLPTCFSYRHVYIPEQEKWAEAVVLHHDWYDVFEQVQSDETLLLDTQTWCGETPDGFRRAFTSYPILAPDSVPDEEILPTALLPLIKWKQASSKGEGSTPKNCMADNAKQEELVSNGDQLPLSPFGGHPFSVEAKRLEFLLGVTALAKAIHNLLPSLREGESHAAKETLE